MSKLIANMSFKKYIDSPGVSHSTLKQWISGSKPVGRQLIVGSVLDDWIFRGADAMKQQYFTTKHDYDLRTKAGQINMQEEEDAEGKFGIRPKERDLIVRMRESLFAHDEAKAVIEAKGRNQLAVFSQLEGFQSNCKALIDCERRMPLFDLKSTGHTDEQDFKHSIVKFGYASQAAFYVDLYATATGEYRSFYWLCVSKRDNNAVWVMEATPEQLAHGRRWYQSILTLYEQYAGDLNLQLKASLEKENA